MFHGYGAIFNARSAFPRRSVGTRNAPEFLSLLIYALTLVVLFLLYGDKPQAHRSYQAGSFAVQGAVSGFDHAPGRTHHPSAVSACIASLCAPVDCLATLAVFNTHANSQLLNVADILA